MFPLAHLKILISAEFTLILFSSRPAFNVKRSKFNSYHCLLMSNRPAQLNQCLRFTNNQCLKFIKHHRLLLSGDINRSLCHNMSPPEFLQPYKERPQTTASVARNLVAGALGLATRVPKEKREEERKRLKEARGMIIYLLLLLVFNLKKIIICFFTIIYYLFISINFVYSCIYLFIYIYIYIYIYISILLKEMRVCVCVCKIGPISARTVSMGSRYFWLIARWRWYATTLFNLPEVALFTR